MKPILLAILTLCSCQAVEPAVESQPVLMSMPEPVDETLTPDEIPIVQMPDPLIYPLTTRIIIEVQPVVVDDQNGARVETLWASRTIEEVKRDLYLTEQVYKDLGIKLVVTEFAFREAQHNFGVNFIMATAYSGSITIVYMLPNTFPYDGFAAPPWAAINQGIVIAYLADKWTLAHEIGHCFGLQHTFEDKLEDTEEQIQKYCTGVECSTPNCHNIMNYCDHEPKEITPQQKERFKRFLRSKRASFFEREKTDILLRGHKLPEGTNPPFSLQNP